MKRASPVTRLGCQSNQHREAPVGLGLWRTHLDEIEPLWESTLSEWVPPDRLLPFDQAVADLARKLRELRLD
jgi:hypothetical protein